MDKIASAFTNPVLLGFVRNGLNFVGAMLIAHGWADNTLWELFVGFLTSGVGLYYGYVTKDGIFERVQSLIRSALSFLTGYGTFKGWWTPDQAGQLAGGFAAAIVAIWTVWANANGIKPKNIPVILLPLLMAGVLVLGGCANKYALDPAVQQRIDQKISTTSDKALAALKVICDNYQAVDAAFDIAGTFMTIPSKYREVEDAAIALISRTCAVPPTDPVTAYNTARDAWATVAQVIARIRGKS